MREIKFRGLRLDNGEWVYGSLEMSAIKAPYILWTDGDIVIDEPILSQESIGQYTGLKDRNGIEIYEGDVIKWKGGYKCVAWFIDGFSALSGESGIPIADFLRRCPEAEIIDNIHDRIK